MEKASIIFFIIGVSTFILSLWTFLTIKKNIGQLKNHRQRDAYLSDQKYFELKSKQDYIFASASIIISLFAFIGYRSIDDIKSDAKKEVQQFADQANSLMDDQIKKYNTISKIASDFEYTFSELKKSVDDVSKNVEKIQKKPIVRKNIYIIDGLMFGSFRSNKIENEWKIVSFDRLKSNLGERLPVFNVPPSLIGYTNESGIIMIRNVSTTSFEVMLFSYVPKFQNDNGENVKFGIWISVNE